MSTGKRLKVDGNHFFVARNTDRLWIKGVEFSLNS